MAVKNDNKRVSIVMDERDQMIYRIVEKRDAADFMRTTATSAYRDAMVKAHYADWTKKPVEAMDMRELALFVATFDMGVCCGSDDNGVFSDSTAATDKDAFEKALNRLKRII